MRLPYQKPWRIGWKFDFFCGKIKKTIIDVLYYKEILKMVSKKEATDKAVSKKGRNMSKETLILLYGGRSAEREVSVLSAESVMRAVNYSRFIVKTYFITKGGEFIKTQEFTDTPAEEEKLLTNDLAESYPKISPAAIYEKDAVVFPVLHGPMGEDGSIQGFLEILRLAYVGPNILSASSTMDKLLAKHVFEAVGVPQVPYIAAFADENQAEIAQEVVEKLEFPVLLNLLIWVLVWGFQKLMI